MPLISVGLPVHNGERFIERAIESVLSQSVRDLELIVVNNASTDSTDELCRKAVARDGRVRYVVQPTNVGAAANFNRALELGRADYFCWLAHDDWLAPDYLEQCFAKISTDPQIVQCSSFMGVADETGGVFREQREWLAGGDGPSAPRRYHSMIWSLRDPTAPVFGVMRRSALLRAGGIPTVPEPDRQLLYDMALRGRMCVVPEVLFFHFGPKGHMAHYGTGKRRRRSWEWLHAPDDRKRARLATIRVLTYQAKVLHQSELPMASKVICAFDLVAATLVRRTRSKVRRLAKAQSAKVRTAFTQRVERRTSAGEPTRSER